MGTRTAAEIVFDQVLDELESMPSHELQAYLAGFDDDGLEWPLWDIDDNYSLGLEVYCLDASFALVAEVELAANDYDYAVSVSGYLDTGHKWHGATVSQHTTYTTDDAWPTAA
jgi:hypothetical protein